MGWTRRGAPSRDCGSGEADVRRREPTLVLERMMNERPPEPVAAVPYVVIGEHGDHHLVGSRCGNCGRSEEHTSEVQSLMRRSYAYFCLKKKKNQRHSSETQN